MTYSLQNRRYIGNKFKLLSFIKDVIDKEKVDFSSVADVFAGTGVVSEYFMSLDKSVIINDNLFSNYIFYKAWLSNDKFDNEKIKNLINYYNDNSDYIKDNYFSDTFSGTYYSYEDAKRIGSIREHIENIKNTLTEREYYILLSSLLYSSDRIANTVGHFEAFLGTPPLDKGVILEMLDIKKYKSSSYIYREDANLLIKKIKADLLYLDPPYNARQYINFYHLLENLAEWKKLPVKGKTLKFDRKEKMSMYSTIKAKTVLEDLIRNAKTKYILVSYNNTYTANSGASINKITEKDMIDILKIRGDVKVFDIDYKFFNSGKTNFKEHKEYLYLCKVNK